MTESFLHSSTAIWPNKSGYSIGKIIRSNVSLRTATPVPSGLQLFRVIAFRNRIELQTCRTLATYSVERIMVCLWPMKFGFGGFGIRKVIILQIVLLLLLIACFSGVYVADIFKSLHRDELSGTEYTTPDIDAWFSFSNSASVSKFATLSCKCKENLTEARGPAESSLVSIIRRRD